MKKLIILLLSAVMLLSTSCAVDCIQETPTYSEVNVGNAEEAVPSDTVTVMQNEELPELDLAATADTPEAAVAMLGADLLKLTHKSGENLLISPLSVSVALGLTAGGAGFETLEQLEKALGRGISFDDMKEFYKSYLQKLDNCEADVDTGNSLWLRNDGIKLKKSYISFADEYFDAEVFKENFDKNTVKKINNWINDETDGMIKELIDDISPSTVMYIINTVTFDEEWQNVYRPHTVKKEFTFTDSNGNKQLVTAMSSSEGSYLEDENTRGFVKDYKGGEYGFAVLLPDEDIKMSDYINEMSGEKLNNLLHSRRSVSVKAVLPKFKLEYKNELSAALKAMGVVNAFSPDKADFSGLCEDGESVYVSQVLHKTYIEVAEQGTRAGAVTAVEMPKSAASGFMSEEIQYVTADRPFIFAIIDNANNLPLFLGVVESVE